MSYNGNYPLEDVLDVGLKNVGLVLLKLRDRSLG